MTIDVLPSMTFDHVFCFDGFRFAERSKVCMIASLHLSNGPVLLNFEDFRSMTDVPR